MRLQSIDRLTFHQQNWFKQKSPNHHWKGLFNLVVDCSSSTNAHPEVMRKWSEKIHAGG